ncbi:hypothetical protein [Brevifollis gellanilyticus]|uniref:Uncharacterized protein n=1 Tax=Brevifollis gellanilyticus TaxID=748831 RepID=A0A512MEA4_9BACT|nr:hypothetical protein [Brevifollis gellanilyticus]GEP45046.1 hypothetical protein BGE01nite_43370 [Brevifollis gellanilyticus]
MSIPLEDLQSALSSVQEELRRVRQRLDDLEKIVSVETDTDGVRRVCLECHELFVRPAHDPRWISLHLGADEDGGFVHLHQKESSAVRAEMSLDSAGSPQMLLRGEDRQPRISFFTQEDCGFVAVHADAGRPGALMRAQPRGGSIAVLQKDGGTRGVLVHEDGEVSEDGTVKPSSTDLLFADGSLNSLVKLHSDGQGGLLSLGPPGQPDAIALVARDDGPAFMLHSPSELQSISMMALDGAAQLCVHEGKVPGSGFEAHISSGEAGSSFSLRGERGEKSVDISALDVASSITLHDMNGEARVMLAHHYDSHSALTLQSTGEEDGFRAVASGEVSSVELMSPIDPDTKLLSAVTANKPVVILQKQQRPLLMFGEGDQGGVFCAYGNAASQAGIATLSGGPVAGSLLLSTADGTPQLTLDATDHGGRMLINNDLGFQRVSLGIYQEAGSLQLNNTGNLGVQAIATAKGGVVMVSDPEGEISATLPEDFDAGKNPDWGQLPDNF